MRIGVVTHYWLPHRGGVEVLAREQARSLADRGHDVIVVSSAVPQAKRQGIHERGPGSLSVELHPVWNGLEGRGLPWPVPSPRLVKAWNDLPRRCDVVIVHGCTYAHSPVVIRAARAVGTPVLLIQANPHVDYPGPLDLLERAADRTLGRWCCHRSTRVVSISRHTARHVARIAPHAAGQNVIYLGVDPERWRPASTEGRRAARSRLKIVDPMMLTVRRLVRRNGVDLAVEAWIRAGLDQKAQFLIVGDGPERARLAELAQGHRVTLLGSVDDATIRDAFAAADAFVLPTRSGEGFGLAAAEAMASGLPVITTTGGAQEELVHDGVTGAVVDVGDVAGLGRAMGSFLTDEPLRRRAGASGRQRVIERFTWTHSIDEFASILADLAVTADGR